MNVNVIKSVNKIKHKYQYRPYYFYGDLLKDLKCKPVRQFPGITTLFELFAVLEQCWTKDTAYPSCQSEWVKEDPSYGQCAITAMLVHDMFGGTIHKIYVEGGSTHYFNKIYNCYIDLTREQFDLYDLPVVYEPNQLIDRSYCGKNKNTLVRYKQLQTNIISYLNR